MFVVDRIDGDTAVVECDQGMIRLPAALLGGAREGDVLVCEDGVYRVDEQATAARRDRARARLKHLTDR